MEGVMAREVEGGAKTCDVVGCDKPAERAVSPKKVKQAGLDIEDVRGKAHLCKKHYKEYKKASKTDRKLDRLSR
jgi:hypothetical protein